MSACLAHRPALPSPEVAAPSLEVSIDEAFYGVAGVTALELNRDLSRRGPERDGARWYGLTDFRLAYRYVPASAEDACRATETRVTVELVTTLPHWRDRDAAPEWLQLDWDLFLTRLREHERGHQEIAILTGEELLEGVAALSASDCETLIATTRRMADALQSKIDHAQRGWDVETVHGTLSGS